MGPLAGWISIQPRTYRCNGALTPIVIPNFLSILLCSMLTFREKVLCSEPWCGAGADGTWLAGENLPRHWTSTWFQIQRGNMRSLASPSLSFFGLSAGLLICVAALQAAPAADGAALFKQKCSMCHGTDGKGFAAIK